MKRRGGNGYNRAMNKITPQDILRKLRHECHQAGGVTAWAIKHKVSPSYVSNVLSHRCGAGPLILRALGYETRVVEIKRRG